LLTGDAQALPVQLRDFNSKHYQTLHSYLHFNFEFTPSLAMAISPILGYILLNWDNKNSINGNSSLY
jgi:hypothetical protein